MNMRDVVIELSKLDTSTRDKVVLASAAMREANELLSGLGGGKRGPKAGAKRAPKAAPIVAKGKGKGKASSSVLLD